MVVIMYDSESGVRAREVYYDVKLISKSKLLSGLPDVQYDSELVHTRCILYHGILQTPHIGPL